MSKKAKYLDYIVINTTSRLRLWIAWCHRSTLHDLL